MSDSERLHEDEVLRAFDKMKSDIKNDTGEGQINRAGDVKVSEEELFSSVKEEDSLKKDHTIFSRRVKHESDEKAQFNAGVIDKDEWDRMIREMDERSKEEAETEAGAAEGEAAGSPEPVIAGRAARKAAEKNSRKSLFGKREKTTDDIEREEAIKTAAVKAVLNSSPAGEDAESADMKEKTEKEGKASKSEKPKKAKKKKGRKKAKKILLRILIAILILCFCAAIAVGVVVVRIIKDTPAINPNNIYDMLSQSSVIYDINGNTIDNIYDDVALRTNVDYEEIPQQLIDAFVAIEDKTFFEHHGFNFVRIAGAVWQKVTGKSSRIGGTSTITQQLARNIYLEDTKSARGKEGVIRKIREAYYTVVIEKALTKEQILEAYLNTVYLGFNSNGIYAAAKAYFNKDLADLTLIECAQLAALPQSPNTYAPLKRVSATTFATYENKDSYDIVTENDTWVTYYNDSCGTRINLVLYYMHEQGKIDDAAYETAKADSIRGYLNPGVNIGSAASDSSYFTDFITAQVMNDLQEKLGYTYAEAHELLYNGGLVVNSTLDMNVQVLLEGVYSDKSSFPKIDLASLNLDSKKNILNTEGDKVLLYAIKNMIDEDGDFWLLKSEYKKNEDGSVTVYKGGRLNFYNTTSNGEKDVRIDIKDIYEMKDGYLYSRSGSYLNIPSKYKSRDDAGNLVLSADFFTDSNTAAYTKFNDKGTMIIKKDCIVLASEIIQPQSAMVIIDNETGQIRAMMGGRDIKGKLLYNRATSTRQPGSSIKPLALYSTALQKGYENSILLAEAETEEEKAEVGTIFTAATVLDNIPMNSDDKLWPSNFDGTYGGLTPLRRAVEKSLNACAVNLYMQLNPQDCIANLLNYGITSLVTEGEGTDENPSSLALGGMTKGISPLEMASAYTTFVNNGAHTEYSCYTTVTNRKGDIILKSDAHTVQVIDEPVADLMLDILQSTVNRGIAAGAKLKSQPSAGKTGTTSDAYDIWFCGLTPKYSATVWIGCDTHIDLGTSSTMATKVWKAVMEKVGGLDEREEFEPLDENEFVTVTIDSKTGMLPSEGEYNATPEEDLVTEVFIKGTEPKEANEEARQYIELCAETGYLATPYCPRTAYKYAIQRPGLVSWEGLLASYTLQKDIEGTRDPETGLYEREPDDKNQYIDIVLDSQNDIPDFYCPVHNNIVGETEEDATKAGIFYPAGTAVYEYEISPLQRESYQIENLTGGAIADPTGPTYRKDPETGEWVLDTTSYTVQDNQDNTDEAENTEEGDDGYNEDDDIFSSWRKKE